MALNRKKAEEKNNAELLLEKEMQKNLTSSSVATIGTLDSLVNGNANEVPETTEPKGSNGKVTVNVSPEEDKKPAPPKTAKAEPKKNKRTGRRKAEEDKRTQISVTFSYDTMKKLNDFGPHYRKFLTRYIDKHIDEIITEMNQVCELTGEKR